MATRSVLVLVLASLAAASPAAQERSIEVTTRARAAAKVLVGTVKDVERGRFDTNEFGDRIIVTRVWVRTDEALKGSFEPVIPVDLEGGSVGTLTLRVSDMPMLHQGERAVLFLNAARASAHTPNGRGAGVLKLDAANRVTQTALTLADVKTRVRAAMQ